MSSRAWEWTTGADRCRPRKRGSAPRFRPNPSLNSSSLSQQFAAIRNPAGLPVKTATPVAVYILLWSAIFVLAAILCAASINAANQCREAVKSIGRDCAPSIIAAQQIKQDLAKLDANSADFLLAKNANLPIYQELHTQAEALKNQFSDSLVTAAQNITFGDSERVPITKLSSGIIRYSELVAGANQHQNNDAIPLIANASSYLHSDLFTAAQDLDKANTTVLDHVYNLRSQSLHIQSVLFFLAWCVLNVVLLAAGIYLWKATKRILNLGILIALFLSIILAVQVFFATEGSAYRLKVITKDAFDSIHWLWSARATAVDAYGARARVLLFAHSNDQAAALRNLEDCQDKILQLPAGQITLSQLQKNPEPAEILVKNPECKGYLADELRNITFTGEREAALAAVQTWSRYSEIDQQTAVLETNNRHTDAVSLHLSKERSGGLGAAASFDQALELVIGINQAVFDKTVAEGLNKLEGLEWIVAALCLGVMIATTAGIWPRIREYVG